MFCEVIGAAGSQARYCAAPGPHKLAPALHLREEMERAAFCVFWTNTDGQGRTGNAEG